ncbi:MAG TPA: AMP-binding protein [Pseudonocardia sp.]|nr:AMP-binding protein [Pseudonocardia sp.]
MRLIEVDGSPGRVAELVEALAAALDGGPPVLPVPVGARPGVTRAPAGTAVVIATSGSTGEPKLVALSAAALRASARATEARLGGPGRWLLALPAEHVAGVQVIVRALLAGAAPAVLDLRAGFRPDAFAAATAALGPGRRYTSLVPTQLSRILDAGQGSRQDAPAAIEGGAASTAIEALRSYAAVLVGGAALDPATRERALAAGVRVVTTYGMSETAGGCVYDGVPLDGVTVDLDPDGRIVLGGPTLASGYLTPTATATAEATDDAGSGGAGGAAAGERAGFVGGRFRTGDLGRWRDGRLEVVGRADDVIVTGGEKVAPAAVERVLAAQPGVRAACVVGLPDAEWGQVVAAAVVWNAATETGAPTATPATPEPDAESLREAVRAALGRAAVPRRIVAVAEIPLRGIGKPDRAAVARLVSAAADPHHPAR